MRLFNLAFFFGVLLLLLFSHLPNSSWIWIILIPASVLAFLYPKTIAIFACSLGFSWALLFSVHRLNFDTCHEKNCLIQGKIISIPQVTQFGTSFLFSNDHVINLTWKNAPVLHAGDQWQLRARLKPIHGMANPNTFDYEAWAFKEGIREHGYVVASSDNQWVEGKWFYHPILRLRQRLKEKIELNIPKSETSPWILALTVGERHGIDAKEWQVLRNTGTNHLMAIAGLHIGGMAALAYVIFNFLWRRIPRAPLYIPAQHVGSLAALTMAFIYSALAGFSIPTQRACIMLMSFLMIHLLRRKIPAWQAWSFALFMVLLINPLSVVDASFWLSFFSVALIIYGVSARLNPHTLWWKWGRVQWVIAIGLIPLSIGFFQQCSLISFIANSIAIPMVAFFIVPLCLFGSSILYFSSKGGAIILALADKLLSLLWAILTFFSHLHWAVWDRVIPSTGIVIIAVIGVILFLLPSGFPVRFFGIFWILPLFLYKSVFPTQGNFRLTLLDVGQGLSAVIQTKQHVLVFDAGAKFGENMDMGESVVAPFLHSLGIHTIDKLVVSHGDNDHIGGAMALLNQFKILSIDTSVPEKLMTNFTQYCLRGATWKWDGVAFDFLYPTKETLNLGNDSSCVLQVSNGTHSVLLTGDIEKFAETDLVKNENLASEILIAPHHGSKTSAKDDFLQAVNPKFVLFPVGFRNRYHFPNPTVVAKYQERGVQQYNTADDGAIIFDLQERQAPQIELYRQNHRKFWQINP